MKKYLLLTLGFLLIAVPVLAQGPGVYLRTDCTTITGPIASKTWCYDLTAKRLKYWNGTTYVSVTASTIPVPTADGGTGKDFSATSLSGNIRISTGAFYVTDVQLASYSFQFRNASPTQTDGTIFYCPDCFRTDPCTGIGSTGAFAKRLAGVWVCS